MRKLKPGKKVVANGQTYKESVPESVVKALNLKDDIFVQEQRQETKQAEKHKHKQSGGNQ